MKYYQWRVVVKWGLRDVVGVLRGCDKTARGWMWELYFPEFVGTKDEGTLDVTIIQLAEGLAKADDLGLAGPARVAPLPCQNRL